MITILRGRELARIWAAREVYNDEGNLSEEIQMYSMYDLNKVLYNFLGTA